MTYRSHFEKEFHKAAGKKLKYEPTRLSYVIPASAHTYTPDFHLEGTNIWIETKGLFSAADRKKMLLVKEQHPDKTFIIVFQNPLLKLTKTSKTTYADWCRKNGFGMMTPTQAILFISNK